MTKTELLEIIGSGENSGVEFKRDEIENRVLAKELVAFSNLSGGMVLLGVDDNRAVCGLTRRDDHPSASAPGGRGYGRLEEWVMQTGRDKIRPELIPYLEILRDVAPGLDVAVVRVEPGWAVHHLCTTSISRLYPGGFDKPRNEPGRTGTPLSATGRVPVGDSAISGSSLKDLDLRRLRDYFGRIHQQLPPVDDENALDPLARHTELMVVTRGDEVAVTVTRNAPFRRQSNRFLPRLASTPPLTRAWKRTTPRRSAWHCEAR